MWQRPYCRNLMQLYKGWCQLSFHFSLYDKIRLILPCREGFEKSVAKQLPNTVNIVSEARSSMCVSLWMPGCTHDVTNLNSKVLYGPFVITSERIDRQKHLNFTVYSIQVIASRSKPTVYVKATWFELLSLEIYEFCMTECMSQQWNFVIFFFACT